MPSKNPRLSVVLTPSLAATLAALSDATEQSASSLVRELLQQTEPALGRMLQLVLAAKGAPHAIGAGVAGTLDRVVSDLEDAMALADARTGRVARDLASEAEAIKGRRGGRRLADAGSVRQAGRGAAESSTPGPVTRGSGSGKTRSGGAGKGVSRG
jgi:hypothetical protein